MTAFPDPQRGGSVLAVYALLSAISLAPLLIFDHPPFPDHPNHLARLHVLASDPGSPVRLVYEPAWGVIPNLATDGLGVLLSPWLAPETILSLVAILGMGGVLLAVALLQKRLFGAPGPFLWLATLPIFNLATSMGYLNYFLGVAVALFGLTLWLVLAEAKLALRVVVFNAIGAVLFFCHFSALAVYGLAIGAYELWRARRDGGFDAGSVAARVGVLIATFALPLVLGLLWERPEQVASFSYADKGRVLMAATWMTNGPAFLITFATLALLLYELLRSRLVAVAPAMRPVLVAFAIASLLLPSQLSKAIDVDSRVFVALVFLFIASCRIVRPSRRRVTVLACVLLAVVSVRALLIVEEWSAWSDDVADFRDAIGVVEPGAAVLVAGWARGTEQTRCAQARREPASVAWHVPSFAVVDRGAFVPLVFTGRGMQPIRATPAYRDLDVGVSGPIPPDVLALATQPEYDERLREKLEENHISDYFLDWTHDFDYAVFLHHGCREAIVPEHLRELRDGSFYTLYRVLPGSGRTGAAPSAPGS